MVCGSRLRQRIYWRYKYFPRAWKKLCIFASEMMVSEMVVSEIIISVVR